MRIAHCVSTFPPYMGGMGNAAFGMAEELGRRGHAVTVLTPRQKSQIFPPQAGPRPLAVANLKFQIRTLRPLGRFGNAAFLPQLFWMLDDFDVVHLHYPFFGGVEPVLLWKMSQRKIPLVVSYHMDAHAEGWKERLFRWHARRMLPALFHRADRVIASSLDYAITAELGPLMEGSGATRVVEVPFGVDTARFCPRARESAFLRQAHIPEGSAVALFVGALDHAHAFKGIDVLLRAFSFYWNAREKHEQGTQPLFLVIVGDGACRPSYVALARELGIEHAVRFAGRVSADELPRYYQHADVTILPSVSSAEAFGMVLLESMACGTPVIASYLAGVRTVVEDGITGFLTKPGDVIGLGKLLHKIWGDPKRLVAMREEARKRVEKLYTWERVGGILEDVYKSLF